VQVHEIIITVPTVTQSNSSNSESVKNSCNPHEQFIAAVRQRELTTALDATDQSFFSREMGLTLIAIAQGREPQNYFVREVAR